MARPNHLPASGKHKSSGQAIVALTDALVRALLGHRSVDRTDHSTRLTAEDVAAVVARSG